MLSNLALNWSTPMKFDVKRKLDNNSYKIPI